MLLKVTSCIVFSHIKLIPAIKGLTDYSKNRYVQGTGAFVVKVIHGVPNFNVKTLGTCGKLMRTEEKKKSFIDLLHFRECMNL